MLKMCMNWKVLAGLAVVGAGVWLVAPGVGVAVLPVLIMAACPLSMLFMMKGMGGMASRTAAQGQQGGAAGQFTCPMHSDVQSDQPRQCPKCGMHLTSATADRVLPVAGDGGTREQQDAIAANIARLESEDDPAAGEAEAGARAVAGR